MTTEILSVYGATAGASALYAWYLQTLDKAYEPNWTWVTVVGGNAIIGMAFLAICLLAPPLARVSYFYHLLALNCTAGVPVIIWQEGQRRKRIREEAARTEKRDNGNDKTSHK
jgi:hypothetical protein